MKKIITILVIMMVLVGSVFAADTTTDANTGTENHTLYVKATIAKVEPIFQLVYGSNTSNGTSTFGNGTAFENGKGYSIGAAAEGSRIDVLEDLDDDKKIVVSVVVNNKAKISQTYALAFSDGVFKNVGIANHTYDLTPVITTDPGVAVNGVDAGSGTTGTVTVHFNGSAMTAESAVTLATATFNYDGTATKTGTNDNHAWDSDVINPGTYTADLKLEITAD